MKFMSIKQISVLGGGSWGTILSNLSCKQGIETLLWMRDKNIAQEINTKKENNNFSETFSSKFSIIRASFVLDLKKISSFKLLASICGGDQRLWEIARVAASKSLEARKLLWDGMVVAMTPPAEVKPL